MTWRLPPAAPRLADGELHLWRFRLDPPPEIIGKLRPLLSPDETARADRLRIPSKKREFIAARGRLRQILARYLDMLPSTLDFNYGPAGKPLLALPAAPFSFNLAHAGHWGLLGLSAQGQIGVDVEWLERPIDIRQIAGWSFREDPQAELATLPPEMKSHRFFQLWTAQEARLKALGTGLTCADTAEISGLVTGHFLLDDHYICAWATAVEPLLTSYWDFQLFYSE